MTTLCTHTEPRIFLARGYDRTTDGHWLDVDGLDADDIRAAIDDLGVDEPCIPCVEGIPRAVYHATTCTLDIDRLGEWLELDEDDREIVAAYWDEIDGGGHLTDINDIMDAWSGKWDDGAAFAEHIAEEYGEIPKDMPTWICIDWEASWNCNLRHDYSTARIDGDLWVWRCI